MPDAPIDTLPASRETIVIAMSDRDARRATADALSSAGFALRLATRPAEFAKALADGVARIVLRTEHPDDELLTRATALPVIVVRQHDLRDTVRQIHEALAQLGER